MPRCDGPRTLSRPRPVEGFQWGHSAYPIFLPGTVLGLEGEMSVIT